MRCAGRSKSRTSSRPHMPERPALVQFAVKPLSAPIVERQSRSVGSGFPLRDAENEPPRWAHDGGVGWGGHRASEQSMDNEVTRLQGTNRRRRHRTARLVLGSDGCRAEVSPIRLIRSGGCRSRTMVFPDDHLARRCRSEAGWPGPWSEPTRCGAGMRPKRFLAASSVPVILHADGQRRRSEGA